MSDDSISIDIIAVDAASNIIRQIGDQFGTLGEIAASALVAAGAAMTSFISEAEGKQDILARMNAILEATGGVSGQTSQSLQDLAQSLSESTRFSDDQVLSVETLLLRFKELGGQYFPEATKAVLDLASATGQDATTAARQLGVALEDPAAGLNLLRRSGIVFTEAQKKQIEAMQKAGDTAGAQRYLLDALSGTVGGVAEKMANTAAGGWDQFNNKMKEVGETIGTAFLPAMQSIAEFLSKLVDSDQFKGFIDGLVQGIQSVIGWLSKLFSGEIKPPPAIMDFFASLALWWQVNGPAITSDAQKIGMMLQWIAERVGPLITQFVEQVLARFALWFAENGPAITNWIDAITFLFDKMAPVIVAAIGFVLNALFSWFDATLQVITFFDTLPLRAGAAMDSLKAAIAAKIQPILDLIHSISDALGNVGSAVGGFLSGGTPPRHNVSGGGGRASGGPVDAGTSYVVGENGPEIFTPGAGGFITPNGGGRSLTLNVVISGGFTDPQMAARQLKPALQYALRDMGLA